MRPKRIIAGMLSAAIVLSQLMSGISASAADGSQASVSANNEGVWLTEIYQNDVKRNAAKSEAYVPISVFSSDTDYMEFIEIVSTHDEAINLNEMYEFYYNDTKLTVTDMDGNSDITVEPDACVILWNYRADQASRPTEEQFRTDMRVPDDVQVLKAVTGGGKNWAANGCDFSVKAKDGSIVSAFTVPSADDTYTKDGFSVNLKVPVFGSSMTVYREKTTPSAGTAYSAQLGGLVASKTDSVKTDLFLTEIRANDTDRTAAYTVDGAKTGDDLMECFELTNTTDSDIVLDEDYRIQYMIKEGEHKYLPIYHYNGDAVDKIGDAGCVIPAGGTAVIWVFRPTLFNDTTRYASYPTVDDVRSAYNIPANVPIYLCKDQNGFGNDNRGLEVLKINKDGGKDELVSSYTWVGDTDCKDNKSVMLSVNPDGPEMLVYSANATTALGSVAAAQLTYVLDDGSSIELRLADGESVPTSITQGEEIRTNFYYNQTGALPRTGLHTYYRFDGEGSWYTGTEGGTRVPHLYESIISADVLFDHDYVEFYVSADNAYRSTVCGIYKVDINKLNAVDGIRTNISEGEAVSGIVSVTANDGADNANTKIYIDGAEQTTAPMLEDGAYLSFYAAGRDSYFKNAITSADNEWIAAIGQWQYAIPNGQAHHIDNRYFNYNAATDTYDVTLRFWAGTWGATVDEYLYPEANREDFQVSRVELKLVNGNTYLPTAIGPAEFSGVDTSAKTNLSTAYDAVHSIGDSANMCPYMDASFSVPASQVTAVGAQIDTQSLSEGAHTLTVTNGTSEKTVTFIVDNQAPVIDLGIENGETLSGEITLNPQVTDENALNTVIYTLDGEQIEAPYSTTAYELGAGEHVLSVYAADAAGNESTATATFTIEDVTMTLSDSGAKDITDSSAKLYLELENAENATATFYKAEKIEAASIATETSDGLLPLIQYTIEVGEVDAHAQIVANWNGSASNSDDTHATTMYVLNTATGVWDTIASADEDGSMHSATFAAKDHVADGKATIIVQCTADSALPDTDTATDGKVGEEDANANWDGTGAPADYDFSFAWITDTQYYSEQYMWHFENMNNYIVDNAAEKKIKYVIHTGDIVDDWNMVYEWENADKMMQIFDDAGMPYGVLGGNHDVAAGLGNNEYYYTYFGEDRFANQPTYGGSYKNNLGHYDLISENGQDMIIVYMSWNMYKEEIDWMNEVLAKYSDRKAILAFHPYTNVKASDDGLLDYAGVLIQKEVVAKNPNVFAVLNGHYHGSSYQTVQFDDDNDGVKDRTVYQICTDYQSAFEGGTGYIKFLYFDLDNDKIYVNSYSPSLNDYNYYDSTGVDDLKELADSAENGVANKTSIDTIVLDTDFDTDVKEILEDSFSAYVTTGEVLGTAQVDENGKAELTLDDLGLATEYGWYAVIKNTNTSYLKTDINAFTTVPDYLDFTVSDPAPAENKGVTDVTWNTALTVKGMDMQALNEIAVFKDYGVCYGVSEDAVAEMAAGDEVRNEDGGLIATSKSFVPANNTERDVTVYTVFGLRLSNVKAAPGDERVIKFYVTYEIDGKTFTEYSDISAYIAE